jgi:acyl-CoA synthetase (AMP-forming)/AMP-acid ligase II
MLPRFSDVLQRHADEGRTALIVSKTDGGEQHISYAVLADYIRGCADGCASLLPKEEIIAPGDFSVCLAGILAERGVESTAAFFGLMEAGFCPAFLDPQMPLPTLAACMDSVSMRVLLTDKALDRSSFVAGTRIYSPAACFATKNGKTRLPVPKKDSPAMMLFTSGSTGAAKGIVLSYENLDSNAAGIIAMTGITPEDRLLHVMPLYHTNGINNQLIAPLLVGATIILADRFRPEQVPSLLERHAITYMTGTPTHYSRILPFLRRRGSAGLHSLRFLRCGSAPITRELHSIVENAFGVELLVSYGLSEATCTTAMNPPGNRRIGSIGIPLKGQYVELFNPGSTEPAAEGEEAEICIRGPSLMLGYISKDQKLPFMNGWLRTGDLGRRDSDGFFYVTGRLKDIIVRGGENISPGLIENIIRNHEAVSSCCVVGAVSDDLGEVPVAFVVFRDRCSVAEQVLRDRAAAVLKPAYVPVRWYFLPRLPENALGKVDRNALRAIARNSGSKSNHLIHICP